MPVDGEAAGFNSLGYLVGSVPCWMGIKLTVLVTSLGIASWTYFSKVGVLVTEGTQAGARSQSGLS